MLRRIAILAALLMLPALSAALGEAAPPEDVQAGAEDAAPAEVGEADLLDPGLYAEGGAPKTTPRPTPTPGEAKPSPTPKGPEWFSSVNYPESRVFFEKEIWGIMTGSWGLTDFQAAGLMGCLRAESSLSPYDVQGVEGVDGRGRYRYSAGDSVGFGLAQWTSSGRKSALLAMAERHGDALLVWDFDLQMQFMRQELDLKALRAMTSMYQVVEWATLEYERPNQSYANSWPGTRYEYALEIYRNRTGQGYLEPAQRFVLTDGGAGLIGRDGIRLRPGEDAALTLNANYYWRLELLDETAAGWLEVLGEDPDAPEGLAPCACGYARDGDRRLVLRAAQTPLPGGSYEATLRFEVYRGAHGVVSMPVTLTHPAPWPFGDWVRRVDARVIRTRMSEALGRVSNMRFGNSENMPWSE